MLFDWILQQDSLFWNGCSLEDLNNVVITRSSFHGATNDILESLTHFKKLDSIGFKILRWLFLQVSRIVKTLWISYIVVESFSLFEFSLFLFEFEPERVLESVKSGWELCEFSHFLTIKGFIMLIKYKLTRIKLINCIV